MTMFFLGIGFTLAVLLLWEVVSMILRNKAQRRYANGIFNHKHQTQTERAGSVEHFKRVMGRADEIE
tara:strand:+ start:740 stop:940 length:201 start_codon:yes stop_codon:yes gene_type:complete